MINYGETHSSSRPAEVDIKETMVFVATDIKEKAVTVDNGEEQEFVYNLIAYTKDEYIAKQDEAITDLEVALTEIYEGMI